MSQAPAMPVFTDALIGDTTHLSAEEFGCYFLLLCATWRNNGQPFSDNARDLARICRVTTRRWQKTMRARIAPFFNLSDGTWRQKRLEKEWQRCARLAEISRSNGAQGGRPQSSKNSELENPAGSTLNHTHKNTPQTPHGGLSRKRRGEAEPAALPVEPWQQRCAGWAKNGFWQQFWGPPPDDPRCTAPPDLIADACQRRKRAA
jgi:uncharacterized protein YdaU (DUF1376 family)